MVHNLFSIIVTLIVHYNFQVDLEEVVDTKEFLIMELVLEMEAMLWMIELI